MKHIKTIIALFLISSLIITISIIFPAIAEDIIPTDQKLVFSHNAGLYKESFNLNLKTGYENAVIRYTQDGSDPNAGSTVFTSDILIEERTKFPNVLTEYTNIGPAWIDQQYKKPKTNIFKGNVIKAQVFKNDGTPLTDVYTSSYFINSSYGDLPVISIVTDKDNFFSKEKGIYIIDNYDKKGDEWERPVHFELFEQDGTVISLDMGVRINGGYTRHFPQKSLRLYARASYDSKYPTVEYDLFKGGAKTGDGDILDSFKRFILRNSGNDWDNTMIRDALIQDLMRQNTHVMPQAYRQSVAFLNGEFWGIYNIRERIDDHSLMRKYKFKNTDDVGFIEHNGFASIYDFKPETQLEENDFAAYLSMYEWFRNTTSLASNEDYEKAKTFIDIDNFIDYYIINTYSHNTDWPGNNNICWRYRTESYPQHETPANKWNDGRWRWLLKDIDFGFSIWSTDHAKDPFGRLLVLSSDYQNETSTTLYFRRFHTNKEFKEKFANRFCDLLNTNFLPNVVNDKITQMAKNIEPAAAEQYARWTNFWSGVPGWKDQVNKMKNFANNRTRNIHSFLASNFSLQGAAKLSLSVDEEKGYIILNNMPLTAQTDGVTNPSVWSGTYFKGLTQTIEAVPNENCEFIGWYIDDTLVSTEKKYSFVIEANTSIEARFEKKETETKKEILRGDINGDEKVNGMDLLLMKQHILDIPGKTIEPDTDAFNAADMNDDGKINGMDLLLLKKKILS